MNYGLLDYELVGGKFNIGDYVQSLAARQYLPKVDQYVNREALSDHRGEMVKMILNGWFMHKPENWPPSESIEPLFVSFHMNRPYINKMMTPNAISYLKERGPIGCRDYHTAEVLNDSGVEAYYSGCLTMTLSRELYGAEEKKDKIMMVDALHAVPDFSDYKGMPLRYIGSHVKSGNVFRSLVKPRVSDRLRRAIDSYEGFEVCVVENSIDGAGLTVADKIEMAKIYLKELSESKLVITSRIHCALPCLALGVPVVFVKFGQQSASNTFRFRGILDHMNVLDLDGDLKKKGYQARRVEVEDLHFGNEIENPKTFEALAAAMSEQCRNFVDKK